MKNTTQVYVLTLNTSLKKTVHPGREQASIRCGIAPGKKIDRTLTEMQQHVDHLQRVITVLSTDGSYSINRSR